MAEEAMNSLDGIMRAGAKPYLLTRINARLNKQVGSAWEKAGRFITRPAVAFTGLLLVIGINVLIIANQGPASEHSSTAEQQLSADELNTSVATLFDTENPEP